MLEKEGERRLVKTSAANDQGRAAVKNKVVAWAVVEAMRAKQLGSGLIAAHGSVHCSEHKLGDVIALFFCSCRATAMRWARF